MNYLHSFSRKNDFPERDRDRALNILSTGVKEDDDKKTGVP